MTLVSFAHQNGKAFISSVSREEQKQLGQFMTPPLIAEFMAHRAVPVRTSSIIRILEPAAGAGILIAATVEAILSKDVLPQEIDLVLFEVDIRLKSALIELAEKMRLTAEAKGVRLRCSLYFEDFLLSELVCSAKRQFDICIANPPYFKLNKADERATKHAYAVHGQPNIYGLFLAASASLISPGGKWCIITPRSWLNGAYFAAVRRHLLRNLRIDALHLFESRQNHFQDDAILQEALIVWGIAEAVQDQRITFSCSNGANDLTDATPFAVRATDIISDDDSQVIAAPTSAAAHEATAKLRTLPCTMGSIGLKVSTGPVVAHRAANYICDNPKHGTVPLLWMQHVTHAGVRWPIQKKREHILSCPESSWMLLPNANYVILRRFSPKEDTRRVTAAPYLSSLESAFLGLENHLNYLHRPGGTLSRDEVIGLTAYLNSAVVDEYFRAFAGSTQVNAAELRRLPIPCLATLERIGSMLPDAPSLFDAELAVTTHLESPNRHTERHIQARAAEVAIN